MSKNSKINPNPKAATTPTLTWKDKLLPEDYSQLQGVFNLFDEDHSGLIDPVEINKIMNELGE